MEAGGKSIGFQIGEEHRSDVSGAYKTDEAEVGEGEGGGLGEADLAWRE